MLLEPPHKGCVWEEETEPKSITAELIHSLLLIIRLRNGGRGGIISGGNGEKSAAFLYEHAFILCIFSIMENKNSP